MKFNTDGPELPATEAGNHSLCCTYQQCSTTTHMNS